MNDKENQRKTMPDFEQLSDRIIAEPTDSPGIVIKTNLDPKDSTEGNPYFKKGMDQEKFREFFEEEQD